MLAATVDRPPPPPGPYLVAGLGRAGQAATRALAERGKTVVAWDSADTEAVRAAAAEAEALGVRVRLGGDGRELLAGIGTIVKSPGIPLGAPLLVEARARGITAIDEIELAWRLDRRPLVAVTGTNGKSTVAAMVAAALETAGVRTAVAGNTQVGPALSALAPEAADVVVAEVSSFQLEACPALLPDAAAFTNLTEDHLDRHGTMAEYERCKRRLFVRDATAVPVAAVNVDDDAGRRLARDLNASRVATAGRAPDADYALDGPPERLTVRAPHGRLDLVPHLPGEHNAANAALALALAGALGVDERAAAAAIADTEAPPGRFELIRVGQPFTAVVDFAHNGAGVAAALEAARAFVDGGRLRAVIGALEAVTTLEQRRAMARAAGGIADEVIVTSDPIWADDRSASGLVEAAPGSTVVDDRASAIEEAVRRARPGDVVIVLGRGMRVKLADGTEFDDGLALRAAIEASSRA